VMPGLPLRRPSTVDVLVVAGLLGAAVVDIWVAQLAPGPRWLNSVIAVLSIVPLAWRRSDPWLAIGAASLACLLYVAISPSVATSSFTVMVAWLIAVHAINAYRPLRQAVVGTGLFLVASSIMVIISAPVSVSEAPNSLPNVVYGWVLFGAAAAAGQVMAAQHRRLAAERVAAEGRARDAERRLIARELHDVIAHGVAVMVVQAGAAQQLITQDPVKAAGMLDAVQETGEQAATELHRMLGLLGDGGTPDLGPQPGLADLAGLVARVRGAGLPVAVHMHLLPTPVPAALQVTIYRMVQEALTNIVKHAPGSDAQVHIVDTAGHLNIDIINTGINTGTGTGTDQPTGDRSDKTAPGRGLAGMRERVHLYGGELRAGPTPGGWRVTASVPLPTASTAPALAPTGSRR
jgi:signal transduction histidine kinase